MRRVLWSRRERVCVSLILLYAADGGRGFASNPAAVALRCGGFGAPVGALDADANAATNGRAIEASIAVVGRNLVP